MKRGNLTVPAAVENVVVNNHAFFTCLKLKIINYHALAGIIQHDVERMIGRATTINSLVVAIKRYSDSLVQGSDAKPQRLKFLKDATITLTSDVADITLRPRKSELPNVLKRLAEVSERLDETPDIFKSSGLIRLIAGKNEYISSIRSGLGKINIARELKGLSKLTLHLSSQTKRDSEFGLFISELLYRKGIGVVHSFIDEDTVILVKKADAFRAYEILDEEIRRSDAILPKAKAIRRARAARDADSNH